ncbi:MAG: fatty acid desaturase [Pseudomonadota bacterium]
MGLNSLSKIEWQTLLLIAGCYTIWLLLMMYGAMFPIAFWILCVSLTITFYLSIQHETVHGHPTPYPLLNQLLVTVPIGWVFPFERFRDTHIAHHETGDLTDPLDDPESWYVYANDWNTSGRFMKLILTFNNTLAGRMLIGPAISLTRFAIGEISTFIKQRDMRFYLLRVWGTHLIACTLLLAFISQINSHPFWAHLLAAYMGISFLLIRTFLEHQAAEDQSERTVIIERSCPIAFLFLFNNLHALHHERPGIPWYRLPATYRQEREELQIKNNYYVYRSYSEIFRLFFFRPKEPVIHPFSRNASSASLAHATQKVNLD